MVLSPWSRRRPGGARGEGPGRHDRLVLVDVGLDGQGLDLGVPEFAQCPRHRLVDDRHVAATHQLLELSPVQVRLDTGRVTVHHRPMVPVGASTEAWALRTPWRAPRSTASSHECCAASRISTGPTPRRSGRTRRGACEGRRASARRSPRSPRGVHATGGTRADRRRRGRSSRGDRGGPGAALVGVVGQSRGHEERPEVRVAETELTELARVLGDLLVG